MDPVPVPHHRKYAELMRESNKRYYYKTSRFIKIRRRLEEQGFSDEYIREYLRQKYGYVEPNNDNNS